MLFIGSKIFVLLPILSIGMTSLRSDPCNSSEPHKYVFQKSYYTEPENGVGSYSTYTVFRGFEHFSDLLLACNQTYETSKLIEFQPRGQVIIDQSLSQLKFITNTTDVNFLLMVNLKGIENMADITFRISKFQHELTVAFSVLDFYLNKTLLRETDCGKLMGSREFFAHITKLQLTKVKYPAFVCPTIFKHSWMRQLRLEDISTSLLKRNPLYILDKPEYGEATQNSLVALELVLEYVTLNLNILSRHLFKAIKVLTIQGTLAKV